MAEQMNEVRGSRSRAKQARESGPKAVKAKRRARVERALERFEVETERKRERAGVTPLARGYFALRGGDR